MTTTFTTAYNAGRAARKFLNNSEAVSGKDFTITKEGEGRYTFALISQAVEDQSQDPADQADATVVTVTNDATVVEAGGITQVASDFEQPVRADTAVEHPEVGSLVIVRFGSEATQVAHVAGFTSTGRIKVRAFNQSRNCWMPSLRTLDMDEVLGPYTGPAMAPPPEAQGTPKVQAPKAEKPAKAARVPTSDKPKATRVLRADGLVEGSSMAKLVDAAKDPAGKTHEEYCDIVGWGQCLPMLKKSVEKAGFTFKVIKVKGEKTRYCAA